MEEIERSNESISDELVELKVLLYVQEVFSVFP